jgi:hypothetical protein
MRYPVEARVSFSWSDGDGNKCHGEGTSRDISETGAFVLAPACPPLGAKVELKVSFVALPNPTRTLHMELEGRVLRVEQTPEGQGDTGFAVLTQGVILHEDKESTGEENPGGYEAT